MIRDKAIGGRFVEGPRTKYFPKSRINQGLISVGPWVNIVLLIIMFVMVGQRLVVQPGFTVALPSAVSDEGINAGLVAVVRHFAAAGDMKGDAVFFDDDAYFVRNDVQMEKLRAKLQRVVAEKRVAALCLYADKDVTSEVLAGIFLVAKRAGVQSVSLAAGGEK